jgi:hypothetical protein
MRSSPRPAPSSSPEAALLTLIQLSRRNAASIAFFSTFKHFECFARELERPSAPHFHVIAPDFEALIEIETLAVLAGSLGRSSRRAVMAWVAANTATIKAEWNRINPRFPTK